MADSRTVRTTSPPAGRRKGDELRDDTTPELLLVTMAGQQMGTIHRLSGRPMQTVGRSDEADIQLLDDGVSRRHAALRHDLEDGEVWLQDLESRNGTWVNGERCAAERALRAGDIIELGGGTALRVTASNEIEAYYAKKMYQAVLRDGLTGLYNRRYLDERLVGEVSFAQRHDSAMSMLMVDIDHFKAVNDTHGHPAGDTVLRHLGRLFAGNVRVEDVVVRYGGEEFAVLCRGTNQKQAFRLAERLRRVAGDQLFMHEDAELHITVSIGVAGLRENGIATPEGLVNSADRAMYRAKRLGRNCCCIPDR